MRETFQQGTGQGLQCLGTVLYVILQRNKRGQRMKEIKFANRWYQVHDTKFSLGMNWYKIEDEPNHFDWISENAIEGYK